MVLDGSIWFQLSLDITPPVSGHDLDADAGFNVSTIIFAIAFVIIIIMIAEMDPAMALADCRQHQMASSDSPW